MQGEEDKTTRGSQLMADWENCGDFLEVVKGGTIEFEGQAVRFELLHANGDGNRLVFRIGEDDGSWTVSSLPLFHENDEEETQKALYWALNVGAFARNFYFGDEVAQVFPKGVGHWAFNRVQGKHSSFSLGRTVVKMGSSETYEWLSTLLSHSASDISFARRFSQSSVTEKWQQIFGMATDEELARAREEMDRLCFLVLCSDPMVWKQESRLYWGLLASHHPHPARFWLRSLTSSKKLASAYLKKWAPLIERFGPLHLRENRVCTREFIEASPRLASGELASPSYHERLEARLELRNWAREHLSEDVWAEIVNF